MSELRARLAAAPLAPSSSAPVSPLAAGALPAIDDLVATLRPEEPMTCLRRHALHANAETFVAGFPGDTMYAVKCNPDPAVLRALWEGGVRHFDCASLPEVESVRGLFAEAAIHFMHPVKSRRAIADSYTLHGVRDFVLDSQAELDKVLAETGFAADLGLVVRLALPAGNAKCDLSGKFGAWAEEAARLLAAARPHARTLGISFHVGSQCLDPLAWRRAIALAGETIRASGVAVEVLDVGGGFPVAYPDQAPPPLGAFFAEIEASVDALDMPGLVLWAEPGRALVANGTSVVVQVQARRGDALYINDGVFGSLSDCNLGFRFPTRLVRPSEAGMADFRFWGPTCDSNDVMAGPFVLPDDVAEGDWIEIGQIGAYGACLRTRFNGFGEGKTLAVRDLPLDC
jgi:ornithine decarboxylase